MNCVENIDLPSLVKKQDNLHEKNDSTGQRETRKTGQQIIPRKIEWILKWVGSNTGF